MTLEDGRRGRARRTFSKEEQPGHAPETVFARSLSRIVSEQRVRLGEVAAHLAQSKDRRAGAALALPILHEVLDALSAVANEIEDELIHPGGQAEGGDA